MAMDGTTQRLGLASDHKEKRKKVEVLGPQELTDGAVPAHECAARYLLLCFQCPIKTFFFNLKKKLISTHHVATQEKAQVPTVASEAQGPGLWPAVS